LAKKESPLPNYLYGFRQPHTAVYHEAIRTIAIPATMVETIWPGIAPGNTPEEDMLKGFRDFILRGNVVDLAVAVVIGTAFNAIVASLVGDVITPLIGALVGQPNFNNFALYVHNNPVGVGKFLTAEPHAGPAQEARSSGAALHKSLPRMPERYPSCRQALRPLRPVGCLAPNPLVRVCSRACPDFAESPR